MVGEIREIEIRNTDTAIEALILEAELIKKLQPPYNVLEKDDKSFLYVEITGEKFPRVLLVRGKDLLAREENKMIRQNRHAGAAYGPFTSASALKEALKILRKIFPWSVHPAGSTFKRACFEMEIGLCPGTCVGAISQADYKKNIAKLKLFFEGKKERLIRAIEKEMAVASKKQEYEKAAVLKRQLFALRHIQDVALIKDDSKLLAAGGSPLADFRIEGYDISNISGESAVGSMIVFLGGKPEKSEYRKFRIHNFSEPNAVPPLAQRGGDVGMMKEVMRRRLGNPWPLPALILVDGGMGQVNAVKTVLDENGLRIPVIGMVKGPDRKRTDIIGIVPRGIDRSTLVRVRDEAHRFAISYHKRVRGRKFFE
jgi:excinuclease ABC subunit C